MVAPKLVKKVDAKKVLANLRLCVVAGQVVPNPKIASVLGPKGIQIPKFCEEVNKVTKQPGKPFVAGDKVTVLVVVYHDKSYEFVVKDSPVSFLLLKALGLKSGSGTPGRSPIASVSLSEVVKIAVRKMPDLNAFSKEAAVRVISGTARSMGIKVVAD